MEKRSGSNDLTVVTQNSAKTAPNNPVARVNPRDSTLRQSTSGFGSLHPRCDPGFFFGGLSFLLDFLV